MGCNLDSPVLSHLEPFSLSKTRRFVPNEFAYLPPPVLCSSCNIVTQKHRCVRASRTLLPTKMSLVIVSFLVFSSLLCLLPGRILFWLVGGLVSHCSQTTPELNGIKQMPLLTVLCNCCVHLCQTNWAKWATLSFQNTACRIRRRGSVGWNRALKKNFGGS